jgi:Ca2+-binding EF-hand superfamily protein
VAAEIGMHRAIVTKALRNWARHHSGHIRHSEIPAIMTRINHGIPPAPENVQFVLACSDQHGLNSDVDVAEVTEALAVWRCLKHQASEIDDHFRRFDSNNSGVLERNQVRKLLTELNEGIPVSWQETDWAIEAADIDGSETLSRTELCAAIAWWYINVDKAAVDPNIKLGSSVPWIYSLLVAATAAVTVRTVSADWSDERTWAWAESSLLGVLFKLVVLDPIKVMCCCEALVGPVFAWLTGELSLDGDFDMDQAVEVVEDTIETRIEQYTGGSQVAGVDWGADAAIAARQAGTLQTNQAVFAVGGLGAAKFARKIEASRNRQEMRRQLNVVERDKKQLEQQHHMSMARTSSIYAEKIRKKREAAGKTGANALDERARAAAEKLHELGGHAPTNDTASVSNFLERARDSAGSTPNDQLWRQAVDEKRTAMSNLERQRTASSAALQAKLEAKRKAAAQARRDRGPRSNSGKVDEFSAAQPAGPSGPSAAFGLSALPSTRIVMPTFDHAGDIDEDELDRIIASAAL